MTTTRLYTKAEAASILGCSASEINQLIKTGELQTVGSHKNSKILPASVLKVYTERTSHYVLSRTELASITRRVEMLEHLVEVLMQLTGRKHRERALDTEALDTLLGQVLEALTLEEWTAEQCLWAAEMSDDLLVQDIDFLIRTRGTRTWEPLIDLLERMLAYVATHDDYPSGWTLETYRILEDAHTRLSGLLYTLARRETPLTKDARLSAIYRLGLHTGDATMYAAQYLHELSKR
jgi:hypothetical protein